MNYVLSVLLGIAVYAVGVIIGFAVGLPDVLDTATWIVLCFAWGVVAGIASALTVSKI